MSINEGVITCYYKFHDPQDVPGGIDCLDDKSPENKGLLIDYAEVTVKRNRQLE